MVIMTLWKIYDLNNNDEQGSIDCRILQSQIEEQRESLENMENMEKISNMEMISSFADDVFPDSPNETVLQLLTRWLKSQLKTS